MLIGVDTGGTFTDFVVVSRDGIKTHKQLSTPDAPERAIFAGLEALGLTPDNDYTRLIHGTTVATNAALEGKGCRTAVVCNRGFGDVLHIGRQARRDLYNLQPLLDANFLPNTLFFEIDTRRSAEGELIAPLREADIDILLSQLGAAGIDAVAVNLLYSYNDASEEQRLATRLSNAYFTSISSDIWPVSVS